MSDGFQKARIEQEDKRSEYIECHFNPTDFSLTKKIKWNETKSSGLNEPRKTFAGGETTDLTIQLLFDVSRDDKADVRDTYEKLLEMAQIDPSKKNPVDGKGEPPRCIFIWGQFLSFTAVIQQIKQTFTMFRSNGVPIRAKVDVTFAQLGDEQRTAPQNPTSRTDPRKIWVVHAGQTLDWIAYEEYGNPAYWRHIAETNNLLNPKDLQPGQILKLVPLP